MWVKVKDRIPEDHETIDGRVPVICDDGALRWGLVIGAKHKSIICEIAAVYWMPAPPLTQEMKDFLKC